MSNIFGDAATVAHKVEVLRGHCEAIGRDPSEVTVSRLSTLVLTGSAEETASTRGLPAPGHRGGAHDLGHRHARRARGPRRGAGGRRGPVLHLQHAHGLAGHGATGGRAADRPLRRLISGRPRRERHRRAHGPQNAWTGYFLGAIASLEFLERRHSARPIGSVGPNRPRPAAPRSASCPRSASGSPPRRRRPGRAGCWRSACRAIGAVVGCRRRSALESVDRVVDLRGDGGSVLGIVGVRLRKDELPRQLGCGEGGTNRAVPVHLTALPPAPGDQEADEEGQEGDDDGQEDPAQRLGVRRGLGGDRGRRGGGGVRSWSWS